MRIWKNSVGYNAVSILLAVGTVSFVWFYSYPLACDVPMHLSIAKALSVLIDDPTKTNYPYALNLRIAPYALAEMLLVAPIKLFGVVVGGKLALSLYCLIFPLSINFLVGQVNPHSQWTRLIGYPLTLNYFFHYGFWPFLVALCCALLAIGLSIKFAAHRWGTFVNAFMRLVTFVMHPIAAIPLAIYDFTVLMPVRGRPSPWYSLSAWRWLDALKAWSLVLIFLLLVLTTNESGYGGKMVWVDPLHQLTQILRPLFITKFAAEMAIPLLLAAWIFYRGRQVIFSSQHSALFVAALLMIGVGTLFPRLQFLGSWEQGVRVVFVGWILLFSLWSFIESEMKKHVIAWILLAFVINVGVSHAVWRRHAASFQTALAVLQSDFRGARILLQEERYTPSYPGIPFGAYVGLWAWALGSASDAYNAAAAWNFGPVKYFGLDSTTDADEKALVIYHPYEVWPVISEPFTQRFMEDDDIYSIYRL